MDWTAVLGIIAGTLTTIMTIPQLNKTLKTKEVEDISIGTFITASIGITLWLIYGIFKSDIALIITNIAGLILTLIMIILKLRYQKGARAHVAR